MRNFICRVLIHFASFGALIASLVAICVFVSHDSTFQPSRMYDSGDFRAVFQAGSQPKIVVLGNSKALAAVSARQIEALTGEKAAQLAYSSADLSSTRLVFEALLDRTDSVEHVLLEMSWFSFSTKRTHLHRRLAGDLILSHPYLLVHLPEYPALLSSVFYATAKNLRDKRSGNDSSTATFYDRFQRSGRDPHSKDYNFREERATKVFADGVAGIENQLLDDFQKIVDLCARRNIVLTLFTSPEDPDYTRFQKDGEEIREIIHLTADSDPHVQYFDFALGGSCYRPEDVFWLADSHHILFREQFTQRLWRVIQGDPEG